MNKQKYIIDVANLTSKELNQILETLRQIQKYRLHCPELLKALSKRSEI